MFFLTLSIGIVILEQIPFKKDINSSWQNYSWSKKEFNLELENANKYIKKDSMLIHFSYIPKNYEKLGKTAKKNKDIKKEKLENLLGMYLALKNKKYTLNGYPMPLKTQKAMPVEVLEIKLPLDYSKI